MDLQFTKLLNLIHAELAAEYIPTAIRWCDHKFDNAWSKAIDRFDSALSVAIARGDYQLAKVEGGFYKATLLDLIRKFKTAHQMKETESFLAAIGVS